MDLSVRESFEMHNPKTGLVEMNQIHNPLTLRFKLETGNDKEKNSKDEQVLIEIPEDLNN